jgi:hypothetical protein
MSRDREKLQDKRVEQSLKISLHRRGDLIVHTCDKHFDAIETRERLTVEYDGARYSINDSYTLFFCVDCVREVAQGRQAHPEDVLEANIQTLFEKWDNGNAPTDWFYYVNEAEIRPKQ